jgi:aminoglycoside phosphotransferase (APT) family kinase protein
MDVEHRLASWIATQLHDARDVRVEGLGRIEIGHSAETLILTVCWTDDGGDHRQDVVIRVRPPAPWLLEPYDLKRQFEILRGLEPTRVRSPKALWFEPSGRVLGREFYAMERLPGAVYERGVPDEIAADPDRIRRMCESMVEQLAAIHNVDLKATGLETIGDGRDFLDRELAHWSGEIRRVQRGPLPALERLVDLVHMHQPAQSPAVTLVHGDPKPGNVAFEGSEVSAVFDWEMATIGDPLADIGWAEVLWMMPGNFTSRPGALTVDEFVALWEEATGIPSRNRPWYRAFGAMKMAVILLVGGHLFDAGHTEDMRFLEMTYVIEPMTRGALHELGVDEPLEPGPVLPRPERIRQAQMAHLNR